MFFVGFFFILYFKSAVLSLRKKKKKRILTSHACFYRKLKALSHLYNLVFNYWMEPSHQGDKCEQPLFKTLHELTRTVVVTKSFSYIRVY